MPNFKLNITYNINVDTEQEAKAFARILLLEQHIHGSCIPEVALIHEGDRSAANLIAPINNKHYKHHKIPINELDYYNEALAAYPNK